MKVVTDLNLCYFSGQIDCNDGGPKRPCEWKINELGVNEYIGPLRDYGYDITNTHNGDEFNKGK